MTADQRIAELENQVRELADQVRELAASIAAIGTLLISKGVLTADEIASRREVCVSMIDHRELAADQRNQ